MDTEATIERLFNRYDIDDSGSLNSNDELRQLVLAIVSKLGLVIRGSEINEKLEGAGTLSDENAWDVEQFRKWFHEAFLPKEAVVEQKPAAAASSGGSPVGRSAGNPGGEGVNNNDATIERLFNRYDIDDSGSLNSNDELRQLVLAIVSKLGLVVRGSEINEKLEGAGALSDANAWDVGQFSKWFNETFMPTPPRPNGHNIEAAKPNTSPAQPAAVDVAVDMAGVPASYEKEEEDRKLQQLEAQIEALDQDDPGQKARELLERFQEAQGLRGHTSAPIAEYLMDENEPDKDNPGYRRWHLAQFLYTFEVRALIVVVIMINSITLGLELDYPGKDWLWVEVAFAIFFTLEMVLKVLAVGCLFWTDTWNVIDFLIVVVGDVATIMSVAAYWGDGDGGASAVSSLRLLRIFKIVRTIAIFERLNLLAQAFIYAGKDVLYVLILALAIIYTYAVLGRNFFDVDTLIANGYEGADMFFGSVPKTMFTLFGLLTQDGWYTAFTYPIGEIYPGSQAYFITFIMIGSIGMLNLFTGIFIQSLVALQADGALEAIKKRKEHKVLLRQVMTCIFDALDSDKSGTLDHMEMMRALEEFKEPVYQDLFHVLKIEIGSMLVMLKHADLNMDGNVDCEEFITNVGEMKQDLTQGDLWVHESIVKNLAAKVDKAETLIQLQQATSQAILQKHTENSKILASAASQFGHIEAAVMGLLGQAPSAAEKVDSPVATEVQPGSVEM